MKVTICNDIHQEIQCRIDYFKQLCRDRQFVDQETWHFYRGSASALNALLSYMERGITGYPDKKTNETTETTETTEVSLDISEKVLKGKEQKGLELREVLENFSIPRNSSRK